MVERGDLKELTGRILGCAIEVHRHLGPGLLESTYRSCLMQELALGGLKARQEVQIPVTYKGLVVPASYRADLIVEDAVLVELKATAALQPIDTAQVITYLRHSVLEVGLLINFNEVTLMRGVRRYAHFRNHTKG